MLANDFEKQSQGNSRHKIDLILASPTRGVPGFATDCPCDVWCRDITTYLLYVGPFFLEFDFKTIVGL